MTHIIELSGKVPGKAIRFLRESPLVPCLAILLLATISAHAQAGGGTDPITSFLNRALAFIISAPMRIIVTLGLAGWLIGMFAARHEVRWAPLFAAVGLISIQNLVAYWVG